MKNKVATKVVAYGFITQLIGLILCGYLAQNGFGIEQFVVFIFLMIIFYAVGLIWSKNAHKILNLFIGIIIGHFCYYFWWFFSTTTAIRKNEWLVSLVIESIYFLLAIMSFLLTIGFYKIFEIKKV